MADKIGIVLGLDVGEKRVGCALANTLARIAHPLSTLTNDDNLIRNIQTIIQDERVDEVVVGLPRNLQGEDTQQTKFVRAFVADLTKQVTVPILLQDEALSSVRAEEVLSKKTGSYAKGDIDALAACFILEDYLV